MISPLRPQLHIEQNKKYAWGSSTFNTTLFHFSLSGGMLNIHILEYGMQDETS